MLRSPPSREKCALNEVEHSCLNIKKFEKNSHVGDVAKTGAMSL